jgi:hypothetical protein
MKVVVINKKKFLRTLLQSSLILGYALLFLLIVHNQEKSVIVMGGKLVMKEATDEKKESYYNETTTATADDYKGSYYDKTMTEATDEDKPQLLQDSNVETYFRPSTLPVLNNREFYDLFRESINNNQEEISLTDELFKTPKDAILNYYSILREASNWIKGKSGGCGSIGNGKIPYPIAYQFLTTEYRKQLSYKQFLKSFENILHISLIKLKQIPVYQKENSIRYFYEIETIEGSDKEVNYFAYYYGFIDIVKEGQNYKISNLEILEEEFLCAPYHGWSHNGEASVEIKYGGWCSLVKGSLQTVQKDYIKKIMFQGTDGYMYMFIFFQLTNDTDVEIAQYRQIKESKWELIKLNPEDCLKDRGQ